MKPGAYSNSGQKFVWKLAAALLVMAALTACGAARLPGQHMTLLRDGGLRVTLSLSCPASQPACDIQTLST